MKQSFDPAAYLDPQAEEFVPSTSDQGSDGVITSHPRSAFPAIRRTSHGSLDSGDNNIGETIREECQTTSTAMLSENAAEFVPSVVYNSPTLPALNDGRLRASSVVISNSANQTQNTTIIAAKRPRFLSSGVMQNMRRPLPSWMGWPSPAVLDKHFMNQAMYGGCRKKCNFQDDESDTVWYSPTEFRKSLAAPLSQWGRWRSTQNAMLNGVLDGRPRNQLSLPEFTVHGCCYCHDNPKIARLESVIEPKMACNETRIPGLANGSGLDFILPIINLFFFVQPIRDRILKHAHDLNCDFNSCLICEIGFVYYKMLSMMISHDRGMVETEEHTKNGTNTLTDATGGPFPASLHHVARALRDIPTVENLGLLPGPNSRLPVAGTTQPSTAGSPHAKLFCSRVLIFCQLLLDTLQSCAKSDDFRDEITCSKTTAVYCRTPSCPTFRSQLSLCSEMPTVVVPTRSGTTTENETIRRGLKSTNSDRKDEANSGAKNITKAASLGVLCYRREHPTFIVELKAYRSENGNGEPDVLGHRFSACLQAAMYSEVPTTSNIPGAPCRSCGAVTGQRMVQRMVHRLSEYMMINCYTDMDTTQSWRNAPPLCTVNHPSISTLPPTGHSDGGFGIPHRLGITIGKSVARVFSLTADLPLKGKPGKCGSANKDLWRSITYTNGITGDPLDEIQHYEYDLVAVVCNMNPDALNCASDAHLPEEGYPLLLMKSTTNTGAKAGDCNSDSGGYENWEVRSAYTAYTDIPASEWMRLVQLKGDCSPLNVLLCVYKRVPMEDSRIEHRTSLARTVPPTGIQPTHPNQQNHADLVRADFKAKTDHESSSPSETPCPTVSSATSSNRVKILARPKAQSTSAVIVNNPKVTSKVTGSSSSPQNVTLDYPDAHQLCREYRVTKLVPDIPEWREAIHRQREGGSLPQFRSISAVVPLTKDEEQQIISGSSPFIVGLDAEFVKITVPTTTEFYTQLVRKQAIPDMIDTMSPTGADAGVPQYPLGVTNPTNGNVIFPDDNKHPMGDGNNIPSIPHSLQTSPNMNHHKMIKEVPNGKMVTLSLARVSVVRYYGALFGRPIFDCYVQHKEEPFDCLTCFSGINIEDLLLKTSTKPNLISHKVLYQKIRFLVDNGVIIIGHGLQKDFRIINVHVASEQAIDTVHLFRFPNQRLISLKYLMWLFFDIYIQEETHDSVEDAVAALKLFKLYGAIAQDPSINLRQVLSAVYAIGYRTKWKIPSAEQLCKLEQSAPRTSNSEFPLTATASFPPMSSSAVHASNSSGHNDTGCNVPQSSSLYQREVVSTSEPMASMMSSSSGSVGSCFPKRSSATTTILSSLHPNEQHTITTYHYNTYTSDAGAAKAAMSELTTNDNSNNSSANQVKYLYGDNTALKGTVTTGTTLKSGNGDVESTNSADVNYLQGSYSMAPMGINRAGCEKTFPVSPPVGDEEWPSMEDMAYSLNSNKSLWGQKKQRQDLTQKGILQDNSGGSWNRRPLTGLRKDSKERDRYSTLQSHGQTNEDRREKNTMKHT